MTAFSAKHLHSWRLFECSSFLKNGLQIQGYMNEKGIYHISSGDIHIRFCDRLLLVLGAGKIAHSQLSVAFWCPAHLCPCVPSWDGWWTPQQDALSRQGPRFVCTMWQIVEIQPEQETKPAERFPCLMVETWWVSTIRLSLLSQTLGTSWCWCSANSPSSVASPMRAEWTRKLFGQGWALKESESIFLLGERGLCKVQGHTASVRKRKPSSAKKRSVLHILTWWWIWMCYLWLLSRGSAGAFQDFKFLQVVWPPYWSWALRFIIEKCPKEGMRFSVLPILPPNTNHPTELHPSVGHEVPAMQWHCEPSSLWALIIQILGTCLHAWPIHSIQSHCLIVWFHKQSCSLHRRNYPFLHHLILDFSTMKRLRHWRSC